MKLKRLFPRVTFILDLEPGWRPTGPIRRVRLRRDYALEVELAYFFEQRLTVCLQVLDVVNACNPAYELRKLFLAFE